jgi:hypothetical protein
MSTVYLDNDDEITSAIGRLRAIGDRDVILVVPPGSKIATSRINFKLLAREAADRRLNVVAVSDEPQVRALAISAGLPAYDTVTTAEQALQTFRDQDRLLAERLNRTMPRQHPAAASPRGTPSPRGEPSPRGVASPRGLGSPRDGASLRAASPRAEHTRVMPSTSPRALADDVPSDTLVLPEQHGAPARRARGRRRAPVAPLIVLGLVLLLVGGVAYGAYVFLPTATITLRPSAVSVSTPAFAVTADPNVAVIDAAAAVIPAQPVTVPVHVSGTFNATGVETHDTKATGTVRFRSENTVTNVAIPAGTIVSTGDGVDFVTVDDVVVPKASFETGPTNATVDVRAVKAGSGGNVAADAISVVPDDVRAAVVSVTNPRATSGGTHVEEQVVSEDDYNAALAALNSQLPAALQQALADPQAVPRGLVAFAQTAQLSAGQPDQAATAVVGTAAPTFALGLDATASVTAVNESQIELVAAARVRAALASGQQLIGDAVSVTHDAGTVVGNTIVYQVQAVARAYTNPEPQALIATVRGKSLADARAALAPLGVAEIAVWPEFVDRLPDQAARISVTVVAPTLAPLPSRSRAASPSPDAS